MHLPTQTIALIILVLTIFASCGIGGLLIRQARRSALHQERLKLKRQIIDSLPYPVFFKDHELKYVVVNRAYETANHVKFADIRGKSLGQLDITSSDDARSIEEIELSVFASGNPTQYEVRNQESDESLLVHLSPLRIPEFSHTGILGTVVDISPFRRAEARASRAERRLNDIAESLPEAIFELTGGPDGKVEFTWAAGDIRGTFGLSREQLLSNESDAFELVHSSDRNELRRRQEEAIVRLEPVATMFLRMRIDGTYRWMRTAGGTPRRDSIRGVTSWSGYLLNVDDFYRKSLALDEARATAESATRAKDRFLAMMSHEVRTPMAAIIGLTELMLMPQTIATKDLTEMLHDSALALLHILDDILDYSRISSGNLLIEVAPFQLRSLIDQIVSLFSATAWKKGLFVYVSVDWRVAATLLGDGHRLRQILTNLLGNAIKFTKSGWVSIRVELLEQMPAQQRVCIRIEDTGPGISRVDNVSIFDPFIQGSNSTAREFGGVGLGLSISKRLASLMQADLELSARAGGGTTAALTMSFPVAEDMTEFEADFEGWSAAVRIHDELLSTCVSNALSSFGFNVVSFSKKDSIGALGLPSDATLLIEEEGAEASPGSTKIYISKSQDLRGNWSADGKFFARGNALHYASLKHACEAACKMVGSGSKADSEATSHMESGVFTGLRILVAEDNPAIQSILAMQFEQLGVCHTIVSNGTEALGRLAHHGFDALITDCHMPRMNGYELAEAIRRRELWTSYHLPIIALTASVSTETIAECMAAGMDDYISKPATIADIEKCLLRLFPSSAIAKTAPQPVQIGTGLGDRDLLETLSITTRSAAETLSLLTQIRKELESAAPQLREAIKYGQLEAARSIQHKALGMLTYFLGTDLAADIQTAEDLIYWADRLRSIEDDVRSSNG